VLLRRWLTPLLLASNLLVSCGDSSRVDDLLVLEDEPPTPPPLDGVDVAHLVNAFPQEPVREGEAWIRPGSVSNIVKKQQPAEPKPEPEPEAAPPAADKVAADAPAGEQVTEVEAVPEAANEQLVAEDAVPDGPPAPQTRARPPARKARVSVVSPPAPPAPPAAPAPRADSTAAATPKATELGETNNLGVARVALATKIENRQPVGVSDTFAEGTRVYLYSMILNPDGKQMLIHHRWYRGEERAASVKLSIKGERWRTWSVIPVYGKGPWRVDIVEPSGRVIHSEKFTVN